MKSVHATVIGNATFPERTGRKLAMAHAIYILAEQIVGVAVGLTCRTLVLWVSLSRIDRSTWPVQ